MATHPFDRSTQRGQVLPLFAIVLVVLVVGVAVVVDGGYAFAQRRGAQNAADFAAMAGTRIVGVARTNRPAGAGTAANVEGAVREALAANDAQLASAQYVDAQGNTVGNVVGAGSIPSSAMGVVVEARTNWQPFLLGVIGVLDWATSARATAYTPGESDSGGVLPVGIQDDLYDALDTCQVEELESCGQALTSGSLILPGGFGWLTFGVQGPGQRCDWTYSLGMTGDGSCQQSNPYLQSQIGPPANSHNCCHEVGRTDPLSVDRIGSLTGNTWGDLSWYIDNQVTVWVPIFSDDISDSQGANGYYGIVGFGAIVFTDSGHGNGNHAKWLRGYRVDVPCPSGWEITDRSFCLGPGGAFSVDVTGEVRLHR